MIPAARLHTLLEQWARWIKQGRPVGPGASGFDSMIHMMMVTGCQFSGGQSGPRAPNVGLASVEQVIDTAVVKLAAGDHPMRAKVLRVEYGVVRLKNVRDPKQEHLAHALGMSVRTYKRNLAAAREHVSQTLEK